MKKLKELELKYMENKDLLSKIVKYIDKVIKYTTDVNYNDFVSDSKIQDACFMNLTQIGESVARIDDDFEKKYPYIKWKEMKGLRNKIVHDYDGVNVRIVWDTIKKDLPILKEQLDRLINNI